jgi:hypothetical protein
LPIPKEVIMQVERMGTFNLVFDVDETDNEYLRNNNETAEKKNVTKSLRKL